MIASLFSRTALVLALAAATTTARAEPLLRGDVIVTAPIVTVGDLFDNAGLAAETAVFRAPNPGTTGVVSVTDIVTALRSAGIEEFEVAGLQSIRVARAGVEIDMPLLSGLIANDLRSRGILADGMDMDLALDAPLPALVSTDTTLPASLTILRYMPGSSTFSARFNVAGIANPLDITGQIQLMIAVPHLTRTLPEGTIISSEDVELRMTPLSFAESSGLVSIDDLIGKQLQRQTRAGVMLRPSDIAAPELISRNQEVTVVFQQGALTLTTTGKALNSASLAQPVTVLNAMTNRVLQGIATQSGTVTVTSSSQQIAGL